MIDFGYTQAETGPRIQVDIDPLYQGQGHGWVTDTKRQLFPCAQRQDQTGLHGIWSNQDGAFRVDLPNADTLLPQLTVPRNNPAKLT